MIVPDIGSKKIYLAVAMLGATVMPHVIYLHSALVQARAKETRFAVRPASLLRKFRHLRYELIDVLAAMNGAWLIKLRHDRDGGRGVLPGEIRGQLH